MRARSGLAILPYHSTPFYDPDWALSGNSRHSALIRLLGT